MKIRTDLLTPARFRRKSIGSGVVLFVAILLLSLGSLRGQTPVVPPVDSLARTHDDRSTVRARYPAAERVRKYQNDRDYQYERDTAPPPDLLGKFLHWLFSLFGKVSAHPVYVNGGQYLLLAGVLAGAIWLLRKADRLGFLFPSKAKSSPLDYETLTENIYAINFDDRIEEARAARNYRLAVRLLYLRALKQLTDRNLIAWQPDKTNRQYAYELSDSPLRADFDQLTTQFEFVWYGDFPIDERRFGEIAAKFNQFAPRRNQPNALKPNKYVLILLAMVVAYTAFDYYRPRPLDWSRTYTSRDKIPFGTRALYELLPPTLGQPKVPTLRVPAYNFLTETKRPARSTYVAICDDFATEANDRQALLQYVSQGNTVFVSANEFTDSLTTALGFRTKEQPPTLRDTALVNNFTNPALRRTGGYQFRQDDGRHSFVVKRPSATTVLGRNARQEPIFLKISYGSGFFYAHALPLAFTNFYTLDPPTADYAFKALSYLPAQPTFWDEYYNLGRFDEEEQSIFRYIYTQPALTWAFYLTLLGTLLFALFAGKRTQRIIPVLEPPRNTSLEFAQTIGRLYFQQGDHDNLTRKKIQYFLASLRERYHLNTGTLDAEFTETLTRKSGASADEVSNLIQLIQAAQRSPGLSESDLLRLNHATEKFNRDFQRI